jgi:uncharacterized protein
MKSWILIALTIVSVKLSAQRTTESRLGMIAKNSADSVVLRWAPTDHLRWSRINRFGYKLERFVLDKDLKAKAKPEQLSPDTLRPWTIEKWKSSFPADHPYAPVAVQAVYGKTFSTSQFESDVASIKAKSQESELRFSFALLMADYNARVADGLALRWVDRTAPKGKRIQYRLISLDPEFPDTAEVGVDRNEIFDLNPIPEAPEVESADKQIKLRWNTHPEAPMFTAWWLERSEDGIAWKRTSKSPLIKADAPQALYKEAYLYYTDTLIEKNYKPYQYRLIGINPFAELSPPSPVVVGMGRDKEAPPAPIMKDPKDVGGLLKISWEYKETPDDLKGFKIGKSPIVNGPFEFESDIVLPVTSREWIDKGTDAIGENYYVVYAVDTSGNIAASLPAYGFLKDSIPPGKPSRPSGSIDTNGIVRLHWKIGPEKDIMGYRVFFANAADHEFSNATPIPKQDTTFTDTITLNTLTKKIYYKIVAVDRNYNHSEVSDILVLNKPDKLPPVEPLFSGFDVSDTAVVLQFVPSSSKDVFEHRLLRREVGETAWNKVANWSIRQSKYVDKSVKGGAYYQYTLVAVDSSGNLSPMAPTADVRVVPKVSRESLKDAKAQYNSEKKQLELQWKAPAAKVKYYVIYRGKDGRRPVSLTTAPGSLPVFFDSSFTGKGKYRFMVKAVFDDNGESPFLEFPDVVVP